MHPPGNPPSPNDRFPPKTVIRPPWRRASMQTSRFVILSRDFPDSVTSGPGPLMPERRISPPLPVTIPRQKHQNKRENNIRRAEKTLRDAFFPRCPCLLYKIGIRPARKDTRRAQENNDCPAIRFYSNRRNTQKAASGMTRMRPEKRFVPPVHTGRRLLISA